MGTDRLTEQNIEQLAIDVATAVGVEICEVDGRRVLLAGDVDGYRVAFRTHGARGRQFMSVVLDARQPVDSASREMQRAALALRSLAAIQRSTPMIEIGGFCPLHTGAEWHHIHAIDHEAWTCICSHGDTHQMPERVAMRGADGLYREVQRGH